MGIMGAVKFVNEEHFWCFIHETTKQLIKKIIGEYWLVAALEMQAYIGIWDKHNKQFAHGTEKQNTTHTFLLLPCLQVVVTEPGWHWKRKREGRKQLITMETAGREDTWSNHGDRGKGKKTWLLKVLWHSFFTSLLNKNLIATKSSAQQLKIKPQLSHYFKFF